MSRERDILLDNTKMLLIFLVVIGHTIAYGWWCNEPHLLGIYNCIYAFHMPLFVFISGYLSRNIACQREKDIATLLFPYLVFQVINVLYIRLIEGGSANWNLLVPHHQNWFILALFIWRLIAPYFKFVKPFIGMSIAILLSIIFSKYNIPNNLLALSYMFVFLPFFVMGYYSTKWLSKIKDASLNILVPIGVLLGSCVLIYAVSAFTDYGVRLSQMFRPPYNCISNIDYFMRYAGFCVSIVMSVSLLLIVNFATKRANNNNFSGGGSILIYLMHYFIVIPLWNILPQYHYMISLAIAIAVSVGICWLFSRPIVIKFFKPLLDLNYLIDGAKKLKQKVQNTQPEQR